MSKKNFLLVAFLLVTAIALAGVQKSFLQKTMPGKSDSETILAILDKLKEDGVDFGVSNLNTVPFCTWDGYGQNATATGNANCLWVIGDSANIVYGDPYVKNCCDLSKYSKLIITFTEGMPCVLLNRDVSDGQWNEIESESNLIDSSKDGWSNKYFQMDDNVCIVDLKQIFVDKGYVRLHAIKDANFAKLTVTNMILLSELADEDVTSLVDVSQNAWHAWSTCGTQFAPAITTDDGRNVQMMEVYEESVNSTGEVMYQLISGLENGNYAIELYANALYTNGRGFSSPLSDGAIDVVYVSANDRRRYVTANIGTQVDSNGLYTIYTSVTDGTLRLSMTAEKQGTNWHTIQIKSLRLLRKGTVIYADNATKLEGSDNPEWTYTVSGLPVIGTPVLSCNASKSSIEGSYVISVQEGSVSSSSPVYYSDGILTIIKEEDDFSVGGFYYLYNIGSGKYYTAGNAWGTQCSVGDDPVLVQFSYYDENDKSTLLLRNNIPTKDGWNYAFFDSDKTMFVDRASQADYGWSVKKVGDYYRIQASGSTEINPTYSSTAYPDLYVGLDVSTDASNTALSPFLSEGENHYIDWALIPGDVFKSVMINSFIPVSFTNDKNNPWDVEGNTAIIRGKSQYNYYAASWLTMSYQSDKRTELKFDWAKNGNNYEHALQVYIDGIYQGQTDNSSYTSQRFYLDAGTHVVAFRDTVSYYNDSYFWSAIKNIQIKEVLPLEAVVLTENSLPLTFTNDSATPWTTEDGYIEHQNLGVRNSASSFSTTFTIDKTSKLQFAYKVDNYSYPNSYNYEDSHNLIVTINGSQISKSWNNIYDTYWCVVLEPDEYTVEWKDTVYNRYSYNYYTQIKDIELSSNWITCELATAGTLGVEALYQVNVLNDVEMLKVIGPMNTSDWTDIKNMTNLKALDLSEAILTDIPSYAFDGKGWINSVILPEGVKSIGEYAFRGTSIRRIHIPSTVTLIGQYAFASTPLNSLTFSESAQLQSIDRYAFNDCSSLKEVIMPNTVSYVGESAFRGCSGLQTIHFSDLITALSGYICRECTQLSNLHLPSNLQEIGINAFYNDYSLVHVELPNSLNSIKESAFYNCAVDSVKLPITLTKLGNYAFRNCWNLKYIELPSYLESSSYYDGGTRYYGYRNNFDDCWEIATVVCRSATPPSIVNDPFSSGRSKSEITLKVPSFAVVNYKLDSYWYQFGNIIEGDDIDYWKITSPLSLTNNRRMNGKPDIDLYYGGQFTVGGNAPMEVGEFSIFVNESNPGRLLNTCDAMTADHINTYYSVSSEKWYFFTPLHDVDLTTVTVSNGASYVFRYYDGDSRATNGTGNSWRNVDNGKLTAGQGYIFRCNADAVVTFPAEASVHAQVFNTSDVTKQLAVYEAAASANKSWNYVGNPYPCYFDIYYMDFTAPITVWTGSTYKAYSIVDDNFALRPMQSFFVQKPDAVDNIIFHKEGRQLTSEINHAAQARTFRAPAMSNRHLFNLQLFGDETMDETRVVLNDEASLDYEIECDASKFMSFESAVPQIFTLDGQGNGYAINERPLDNGKVKLAYYAGQSGFFTISADRADGEIYLYDAEANKTVNLMEQDYTFHSYATEGTNTNRFMLSLSVNNSEVTGIEDVKENKNNSTDIYDLQGRKVQSIDKKGIYIQNGQKVIRQ